MKIYRPAGSCALIFLIVYVLPAAFVTLGVEAAGVAAAGRPSTAVLFQSHEALTLRIEAPFKKLLRKRGKDRPYMAGALLYTDAAGKAWRLDLKLRVRGRYRAKPAICKFPPLKLNFAKKSLAGTLFDGEDKLKLVTHCQADAQYEQFVLLEYLNYRVHNLFTDYSLRPRLVRIEYYDTDAEKVIDTKPGFFIEDQDRMAARLGAERLKVEKIGLETYDATFVHFASIFEYLLANTDYSLVLGPPKADCCHNIIPLRRSDGWLVPVPYDFDATGIVNPPYVSPPEHLGIRSLRQRLYRGYCQSLEGFKQSFAPFQQQRDAIIALYNELSGLDEKTLSSTLAYLDEFYLAIGDDEKINSEFIDKCR